MDMAETLAFIHCSDWRKSRPGLARITELTALLGNPQEALKFVHVAGSNGKGSVCAMLASVLTAAGYRTGLFTSPHLLRVNERLRIDGAEISDAALTALAERIRPAAERMEDPPTEFERLTAMGLCWFREQGCRIVVLEVGLGGRLDATNVIPPPEAAVVTNIALEHTEILGGTLEKIAGEKAGIIKRGCEAVVYRGTPEVERVYETLCAREGVPLHKARFDAARSTRRDLDGQRFDWMDETGLELPLPGDHQLRNAVVALETVEVLRRRGWVISQSAVRAGLGRTHWAARLELLSRDPLFLVDGAHNPQCMETLARNLDELLPGQKPVFLLGVLADKDCGAMLAPLLPRGTAFVCLAPDSPRALAAEALAAELRRLGGDAVACTGAAEGIAAAFTRAAGGPVAACGSLYLMGEVEREFPAALARWRAGDRRDS